MKFFIHTLAGLLATIAVSAAVAFASPLVSDGQAPNADRPRAALDFMVGTWRVMGRALQKDGSYASDTISMRTATQLFEGSDTNGVMIHGYPPKDEESGESPFGISYFESYRIFVYHAETTSWRGVSHNTLGNRKILDGHIKGEAFYFDQRGELFRAAKGVVRFTYHSITASSYKVRIDYSPDEGKNWHKGTYLMDAKRVL